MKYETLAAVNRIESLRDHAVALVDLMNVYPDYVNHLHTLALRIIEDLADLLAPHSEYDFDTLRRHSLDELVGHCYQVLNEMYYSKLREGA